jgi:hypothetical protein
MFYLLKKNGQKLKIVQTSHLIYNSYGQYFSMTSIFYICTWRCYDHFFVTKISDCLDKQWHDYFFVLWVQYFESKEFSNIFKNMYQITYSIEALFSSFAKWASPFSVLFECKCTYVCTVHTFIHTYVDVGTPSSKRFLKSETRVSEWCLAHAGLIRLDFQCPKEVWCKIKQPFLNIIILWLCLHPWPIYLYHICWDSAWTNEVVPNWEQ